VNALQGLLNEGYCVLAGCLSAEQVARVRQDIDAFKLRHRDAIARNANAFGHLYRVVNLHLAVGSLADAFAGMRPALETCDRFLESPTSLYTSLYFERGSEQSPHRDSPYFCTVPANKYLGVWLALDDVDAGNGPLRVTPRSHALPDIDVESLARELFGDPSKVPASSELAWDRYQSEVQAQCTAHGLTPRDIHVRAGDVIIWHPLLLHGGAPHTETHRSRRSLVMHVTPVGTPVYHMDVFFNPHRQVQRPKWTYLDCGGRKILRHRSIDFNHQYTVPLDGLR
jgi:phytanoyl-CoA hydroxylase